MKWFALITLGLLGVILGALLVVERAERRGASVHNVYCAEGSRWISVHVTILSTSYELHDQRGAFVARVPSAMCSLLPVMVPGESK